MKLTTKSKTKKYTTKLSGLHILGGIDTSDKAELLNLRRIKHLVSKIIKEAKLHELGSFYHKFPNSGFTGLISLVESHISIHTWPELNYLTLDVYLCNYNRDNIQTCKLVFDKISKLFNPIKIRKKMIRR